MIDGVNYDSFEVFIDLLRILIHIRPYTHCSIC